MIDLQKQIFEAFQVKEATRVRVGISVDANVFKLYSVCVGILMIKTILMSCVTRESHSNQQVGHTVEVLSSKALPLLFHQQKGRYIFEITNIMPPPSTSPYFTGCYK